MHLEKQIHLHFLKSGLRKHLQPNTIKMHMYVPYHNTCETESKQQNAVSENASSCVCRDDTVIPTLNLASAY